MPLALLLACGRATPSPTPASTFATTTPLPTPLANITEPTDTLSPIAVATSTPQRQAGDEITSPDATATPAFTATLQPQCTVDADSLNVREGPDTQFNAVGVITRDTPFEGQERTPDAAWVLGISSGIRGWVSAAFLNCSYDVLQLPVAGTLPPTYTPLPTATSSPPTATPLPAADTPTTVPSDTPSPLPTDTPEPPPSDTPIPESPLKRNDTPPEGVQAQLGFFTPFIPCPASEKPLIAVSSEAEIAQELLICFAGFETKVEIAAQVKLPDGTIRQNKIEPSVGRWLWISLPGDPLGEYTVIAQQGDLKASGTFAVRTASVSRIAALTKSGPPGTSFQFALAGFQPGQALYLYRLGGSNWVYATELPPAQVDGRGEAIYKLSTHPDDPPGTYVVVTEPIRSAYVTSDPELFRVE